MLGTTNPLLIKKSPVVIVKNFIILQLAVVVAYITVSYWAHYAQIYRSFPISKIISFQIAQAIFIFGVEVFLVFFIFFRWYKEFWLVKSGQIVHGQGILHNRRTIVDLQKITNISYHQSPLGKLVKYGTIELTDPLAKKKLSWKDLPEPQKLVNLILSVKGNAQLAFADKPNWQKLLASEEDEKLEFKSTLRWDRHVKKVNRHLEKSALKTVAAFLNSHGGYLVLGVDDQKKPIGLQEDYQTLGKPNADGFENHFSHLFHKMIGAEHRHLVKLHWYRQNDKECCVVNVSPSFHPVYLRDETGEEFYIRTGNGSTSLKFSEASPYIQTRFVGQ